MTDGSHHVPERHLHSTVLSDFILGGQDGLVNVLGILLGLVAASVEPGAHVARQILIVAALSALAAEVLSMAAVAYTSTYSRWKLYGAEREREIREMREVPELEREEVRVILRRWGYQGAELEEMLHQIETKPRAWLDLMMAFELNLAFVPTEAPRKSAGLVGGATLLGGIIPLIPFLFGTLSLVNAAIVSVVLSALGLFGFGFYEARVTDSSIWRSGLRIMAIGLASGFAGFIVGHFVAML